MIDGHAHACGKYLTAETIIETLDHTGLSHVVLVPGELNSTKEYALMNFSKLFPKKNVIKITNELSRNIIRLTGAIDAIPAGNEHVYSLVKATGGRVIQFYWVTKAVKEIDKHLDSMLKHWQFKGLKMHQCWEDFKIHSEYFNQVANWAEKNSLPLFIHLSSDADVLDLIEYKKQHPNLKLIIAHLFGLEIFIDNAFKDENLYFDISPFQMNSDLRVLKAIDFVGSDHLLMGSDMPYGKDSLQSNIHRIKALKLAEKDKALILGDNMRRLLCL